MQCRLLAVGLALTAAVSTSGCAKQDVLPRVEGPAAAREAPRQDGNGARRMRDAIERLRKRGRPARRAPDSHRAAGEKPVGTAGPAGIDAADAQPPRPISSIGAHAPQAGVPRSAAPEPPAGDASHRVPIVEALGGPVGVLAALAAAVLMLWWAATRGRGVHD